MHITHFSFGIVTKCCHATLFDIFTRFYSIFTIFPCPFCICIYISSKYYMWISKWFYVCMRLRKRERAREGEIDRDTQEFSSSFGPHCSINAHFISCWYAFAHVGAIGQQSHQWPIELLQMNKHTEKKEHIMHVWCRMSNVTSPLAANRFLFPFSCSSQFWKMKQKILDSEIWFLLSGEDECSPNYIKM